MNEWMSDGRRANRRWLLGMVLGAVAWPLASRGAEPSAPLPAREFRAAWVATVGNIDWPSRPGLATAEQQREALAILDRAVALRLNAIVLQVRPAADALYDSKLEPWSYFLTGEQGKPPAPYYDPLTFWIEQAHRRGLQLHAWFNPFRARPAGMRYAEAPSHVVKARPDLAPAYGDLRWMDPGEPEAFERTLGVFLDVATRYDVDGIHVDDYFYPYPVARPDRGGELDFPDEPSWRKYKKAGGALGRADWRRDNINRLMAAVYQRVKQAKPHVLVGISPFGIPRPGQPPEAKGFDQYDKLYADAVRWLEQGWCDYLSPQLYWRIEAPGQPFRPLLKEWLAHNAKRRHVWPGLSVSRVNGRPNGYAPEEILNAVAIIRETPGASGEVLFSMKALMDPRRPMGSRLQSGPYVEPALVPESPWLAVAPPPAPRAALQRDGAAFTLTITAGSGPAPRPLIHAVSLRRGAAWTQLIHPASAGPLRLDGPLDEVTIRAVGRAGAVGDAVVVAPGP